MATNVARLISTLEYQSRGGAATIREAQQFAQSIQVLKQSQEALAQAEASASAQTRRQANSLREAVSAVAAYTDQVAAGRAEMEALGATTADSLVGPLAAARAQYDLAKDSAKGWADVIGQLTTIQSRFKPDSAGYQQLTGYIQQNVEKFIQAKEEARLAALEVEKYESTIDSIEGGEIRKVELFANVEEQLGRLQRDLAEENVSVEVQLRTAEVSDAVRELTRDFDRALSGSTSGLERQLTEVRGRIDDLRPSLTFAQAQLDALDPASDRARELAAELAVSLPIMDGLERKADELQLQLEDASIALDSDPIANVRDLLAQAETTASGLTDQLRNAEEAAGQLVIEDGQGTAYMERLRDSAYEAAEGLTRAREVTDTLRPVLDALDTSFEFDFNTESMQEARSEVESTQRSVSGLADSFEADALMFEQFNLKNIVDEAQAAKDSFESYGLSVQEVRALAPQLETRLLQLADAYDRVSQAADKGLIPKNEGNRLKAAIEDQIKDVSNSVPARALKALKDYERMAPAAARAASGFSSAINLSRTSLNGLITLLRTGRVNTALLGEVFSRAAGKMIASASKLAAGLSPVALAAGGAVAALIAIPFIAIATGIGLVNSRFGQLAQRMSVIPDEAQKVAASLKSIRDVGDVDLAGIVFGAQNRAQSFGAETPGAAAGATAEAAGVLQYLNATPDDFAQTFQALQRSIETLNFENLRDFGIEVTQIQEDLRVMAEQGFGEAEQRAYAFGAVLEQVAGRSSEAISQARDEALTWGGVMGEVSATIQGVFGSEQVQNAVQNFLRAVRRFLPAIGIIASNVGKIFVWVLDRAAELADGIADLSKASIQISNFIVRSINRLNPFEDIPQFDPDMFAVFDDFDASEIDDIVAGFGDMEGVFDGFSRKGETTEEAADRITSAIQRMRGEISQGQGIVSGLVGFSDALADFDKFGDPEGVFKVISAVESLQDLAVQGADLDALQVRVEGLFRTGIINADLYREAMETIAAADPLFQPFADEAAEMEARVKAGLPALDSGAGKLLGVGDAATEASSAVLQLGSDFLSVADSINNTPVTARFTFGGVGITAQGLGGGGGSITPPYVGGAPTSITSQTGTTRSLGDAASATSLSQSISSWETTVKATAKTTSEQTKATEGFLNGIRDFGTKYRNPARSGGGGGGGGQDSRDATIEQIRELINQVNSAISIASRGGLRLGTGGNVVPFEEGSFLDARGGDLNIQTIQIRGIWDFADPEAKRQILRELEEALEDLKAEAI